MTSLGLEKQKAIHKKTIKIYFLTKKSSDIGASIINWDNKKDFSNEFLQKYRISKIRHTKESTLKIHTNNIGDNEYWVEIKWINSPGKPLLTNPPA